MLAVGVSLESKRVIETNRIRVTHRCINRYLSFKHAAVQSKNTERFSYIGGGNVRGRHMHIEAFKRRAGLIELYINSIGLLVI